MNYSSMSPSKIRELIDTLLQAAQDERSLPAAMTALAEQNPALATEAQGLATSLANGATLSHALESLMPDKLSATMLAICDDDPCLGLSLAIEEWELSDERRALWWQAITYPCVTLAMVVACGVLAMWWQQQVAVEFLLAIPVALVLMLLAWLPVGQVVPALAWRRSRSEAALAPCRSDSGPGFARTTFSRTFSRAFGR